MFWTDAGLTSAQYLWSLVKDENLRQLEKWGVQAHRPSEWALFTTEELGELAKAIGEYQYRSGRVADIVKEAIQVATLALKIAEMANNREAEKT